MSDEQTTSANKETAVTQKSTSAISLKDVLVPISIVIAGLFVGAGLFFSGGNFGPEEVAKNTNTGTTPTAQADTTNKLDPVTESDWIKGDINAPIKIVEFSDFECPFCKRFHETVQQVMDNSNGEVAWVFRQFPLEQLHKKAIPVAIASECVGELGGDAAFWTFTDGYFRDTLTNDRTDIETLIPKLVLEAGIQQQPFTDCFESARTEAAVNTDLQDAVETGGRGTPWSIIVGPTGKTYQINGAQPAAVVEQLIKLALEEAK